MAAGKPVHILLVDDDDVDVMAVQRALRAKKVVNTMSVAHDGLEALAMLRGQGAATPVPRPYVILLDLNMPRMDGIEFLHELRKDPDHQQAIVFVLTTSKAAPDKKAAYDEHVAGYIVKSNIGNDFCEVMTLLDCYWRIVEFP